MADSISGVSSIQGADAVRRETQQREAVKSDQAKEESRTNPQDEVSISPEALQLAEEKAQEAASRTQQLLQDNREETLGLDRDFDQDA